MPHRGRVKSVENLPGQKYMGILDREVEDTLGGRAVFQQLTDGFTWDTQAVVVAVQGAPIF